MSTAPRKSTLFDDLDAGTAGTRTAENTRALLEKLSATADDESSLSSLSEDEFEDVPSAKRQKALDISDDEDEDIEFEDVETRSAPRPSGPPPSGDLELTLKKDERISLTNPLGTKKGPSKIEREIRTATHKVHVQMLMWHNSIRNSWLCDKEVQEILVKQLPASVDNEIERWRRDSGLASKKLDTPKGKSKGKGKIAKAKKVDPRIQRDWGEPAQRLAAGEINMSRGDPLFRLLKFLLHYWKQRFRITAPGLRKLGYMSLERLDEETKSFNKDDHDPERHGERIRDIKEFRKCARALEGSRDVGAQLFTALLRALGLEARMIANLQPVGFGWSQNEEATEENPRKLKKSNSGQREDDSSEEEEEEESDTGEERKPVTKPAKNGKGKAVAKPKKPVKPKKASGRRSSRGNGLKDAPIDLSESEESAMQTDDDDESVVDVTPAKTRTQPSMPYDKDLLFPHYWTEVLSPVTNTYTPVDAVVLQVTATRRELLEKFEPRGGKADKAKQVTTYIVGHSSNGTAKDVTVRYLKHHMLPGRTKGNRITTEKIPVRNRHGKVKYYEEYDWFKTVISGYVRGSRKAPRTEIDDHEEATDLKPAKREKKEVEEGKETLQYYKSSEKFVLERHLRREEALLPTAKHVKMFIVKGKGEATTEERVFLRKDVVSCKTMETWHKEGRAPIPGQEPLKRVPYRAATTNRKREIAEAELASGEKVLQGLFSRDQTDWIIPPPIENGIIPKNDYGNMDVYVPSMVPEGAVHIPRRGTAKICKHLQIDFAEAVTGFEFGHRMAVPIITGVVVATENLEAVLEEWGKAEAERVRKEDEKRTKVAIGMWRKMLMGMRIVERVREEYGDEVGHEVDVFNPWTNKKKGKEVDRDVATQSRIMEQRDEDMAGGFLPQGHDEEAPDAHHSTSFFPVVHEDDDEHGGGFVVEGHDEERTKPIIGQAYPTPQSLSSAKQGIGQMSEEDVDMDDAGSEIEAPVPKKRAKLSGTVKRSASTKKPAKQSERQKKSPASKSTTKGKRRISKLDGGDDTDDSESSLSELESDGSVSADQPPLKNRGRRATMPVRAVNTVKKTPTRNAARKSETAIRSHYFVHSDDDEDDE